ncbi:MAG TPA: alanine racemase [Steroidobacteraceae bacterium]|nr:alanine racemase [Steroidobacteraceae bacterium]
MSFPRARLDRDALRNNLNVVRRLAPQSRIMAVIKADAYGHGVVPVSKALHDADAFGLARLQEAIAMRNAGVTKPLVLLEGVFSVEQLQIAAQEDLEIVVHCLEQVQMLQSLASSHRFTVWLKLDSGMHRLGFSPEEFEAAYQILKKLSAVRELRLMTHLASADQVESPQTSEQIVRFQSAIQNKPEQRSIANSAGVIAWPNAHGDWVRPGLMLYGMSPIEERSAESLGLRPVMTLTTEVIAVQNVRVGEPVGYNARWRATRDSRIAIAAIGYGDGYPRNMPSGTPVLVNDRRASIAGRVSMDMIAIDVTEMGPVKLGDPVTLWGKGLPTELIAKHAQTNAYELVCRINERVSAVWD